MPDQSYGEWVIYDKRIPKYLTNVFNEKNRSDKLVKNRITVENCSIDQIIANINKEHKTKLHLEKRFKYGVKVKSEIKEISLNPIPIELLNSAKLELNKYKSKIEEFILNGVNEFSSEKSKIQTVGVYSCPRNGWISLNFNKTIDLESTGKNCPNFEFPEYFLMNLFFWELEYEKENPSIIDSKGEIVDLPTGFNDDEFNAPFFKLLQNILEALSIKLNVNEIYLQTLDSKFEEQIK
jgi:hypothetical protein